LTPVLAEVSIQSTNMSKSRPPIFGMRVSDEDRRVMREVAERLGVSEAAAVRIGVRRLRDALNATADARSALPELST
jgi:hypothetical protein